MEPDAQERQRLAELYARMSDGELEQLSGDANSLTEMAAEALKSEIERRDLTPEVEATSTHVVEHQKLIPIQQYRDLPEALIAKGILNSAGIECFLSDEIVVRMGWFWSNLMGGVKLHVKLEDVDAAREYCNNPRPKALRWKASGSLNNLAAQSAIRWRLRSRNSISR